MTSVRLPSRPVAQGGHAWSVAACGRVGAVAASVPADRVGVPVRATDTVRMVLPDEPPRLTPGAAKALLRILIKASDQLDGTNNPEERSSD
jgi:hypothetical protein